MTVPAPLTPDTLRLIRSRARAGYTERAIAADLGWTPERLRRICAIHGIEITPLLTPRSTETTT